MGLAQNGIDERLEPDEVHSADRKKSGETFAQAHGFSEHKILIESLVAFRTLRVEHS
jgi:hypothetical protein